MSPLNKIKASRSAIVMISHDRRFLENLSRATVWLDRGETRRLDKGFAFFEAWRDEVLEQEEMAQHKLDRQINREEHWLRYGVSARFASSQYPSSSSSVSLSSTADAGHPPCVAVTRDST